MKRELFLTILIVFYIILLVLDRSLLSRTLSLIDYRSLVTITTFLIVSRGLELSGFFGRVAQTLINFSGNSEFKLSMLMIASVALTSAIIMNDNAIFVFVPLVLTVSRMAEIDLPKIVSFVAIAANIGSSLTPFGNPQNIIIWRRYDVPALDFIRSMAPNVLLWMLILVVFVWISTRKRDVEISSMPRVSINRRLIIVSTILFVLDVLLTEFDRPYIGLTLTVATMSIFAREAILSIDFAIVAVFAFIFIDFGELSGIISAYLPIPNSEIKIVVLSAILSQLISNVPATVLLASVGFPWLPLVVGVNIGGTGFIIGSLANLIAIRISKTSLKDFHRYSIPYFAVTMALTLLLIAI